MNPIPKPKRQPKPRKAIRRSRAPIARKSARKYARDLADRLWSFLILESNPLHVARPTDAHHLWPKSTHPEVRWSLANGVALRRSQHEWAHLKPENTEQLAYQLYGELWRSVLVACARPRERAADAVMRLRAEVVARGLADKWEKGE